MITIYEGIVWSWHGWVPSTLHTHDGTFDTSFKEILVVWKWKVQRVATKQFGDGMELIRLNQKPHMLKQQRPELVSHAVSIYKSYDEESDLRNTYAYRFPKDQELINEVNSLLPEQTHLQIDGKFVRVTTDAPQVTHEKLRMTIVHNGERWALSFLYGLSLLYGQRVWEGEAMHLMIPLQWSIIDFVPLLEWLEEYTAQQWWMISCETKTVSLWQHYEIMIADWTLLEQFAHWQWVEWPLPGRQRADHYLQQTKDYLNVQNTSPTTIDKLSKGALKLRKK